MVCVVNKSQTAAMISVINDFPGSFATFGRATAVIGNFKRLDSRGKPVGIQLIAPPFCEQTLLKCAYAYEQTAGFGFLQPEFKEGI